MASFNKNILIFSVFTLFSLSILGMQEKALESWILRVPIAVNQDPDMLMQEVIKDAKCDFGDNFGSLYHSKLLNEINATLNFPKQDIIEKFKDKPWFKNVKFSGNGPYLKAKGKR